MPREHASPYVSTFRRRARRRLLGLASMALGLAGVGFAATAHAEVISLSALGFVMHCPCTVDAADDNTDNNGLLEIQDQNVRLYASVPFPKDGESVCSMSLVYRDLNANDPIRARLFRKTFAATGNPAGAATLMATATSGGGVSSTTRIATTTAIAQPVINKTNAFYYVMVTAPTINLAFLGVQLDVKPTC